MLILYLARDPFSIETQSRFLIFSKSAELSLCQFLRYVDTFSTFLMISIMSSSVFGSKSDISFRIFSASSIDFISDGSIFSIT